uniref:Uncharacterized protein n=1 Tax=Rhizophagus irregularis (strain DAOM 181602 / DAOM 197198 / MUCL 43194) TaxID=747089 RepID=U9TDU8_RHIID
MLIFFIMLDAEDRKIKFKTLLSLKNPKTARKQQARKTPLFPIVQHYNFPTPIFSFSPPNNGKNLTHINSKQLTSVATSSTRAASSTTMTGNFQSRHLLHQSIRPKLTSPIPSLKHHTNSHACQVRLLIHQHKFTPPPVKKQNFLNFLIIPDDLLPFASGGPLCTGPDKITYLNKLRELKRAHDQAETHTTMKSNIVDHFHKASSTLVESFKELDKLNTDTDSLSENQSELTLRKAQLAKTYKEFNLPYSDINQPHYELIFPVEPPH